MKTLIERKEFVIELRGWAWRGIFCALPSAGWAWMLEFRHPLEIVAILLVMTGFIVVFALGSTWMAMQATPGWLRFQRALKVSAHIKIGTLVGAAAYWTMWVGWLPKLTGSLVLLIWPDLLMGLCSVELGGFLRGMHESTDIARLDSFVFTGLITLLQGSFLTVLLVLLALVVMSARSLWFWTKCNQFFPASV